MASYSYGSETEHIRTLGDFRGVDYASAESQVSLARFAYLKNMYRDYAASLGGAIETFPGYRRLASLEGKVHGIWAFRPDDGEGRVMVHAGTHLYVFKHSERDMLEDAEGELGEAVEIHDGIADARSAAYFSRGRFYLLDGTRLWVWYNGELSDSDETPYIPITYVNGEMYEQRNMLYDRTINRETQMMESENGQSRWVEFETRNTVLGKEYTGRITGWKLGDYSAGGLRKEIYRSDTLIIDRLFENFDDLAHHFRLDAYAFEGDEHLKNLEIYVENFVPYFGEGCFKNCKKLTNLKITGNYERIIHGSLGHEPPDWQSIFEGCDGIRRYWGPAGNFVGDAVAEAIPTIEELWTEEPPYRATSLGEDIKEARLASFQNLKKIYVVDYDEGGATEIHFKNAPPSLEEVYLGGMDMWFRHEGDDFQFAFGLRGNKPQKIYTEKTEEEWNAHITGYIDAQKELGKYNCFFNDDGEFISVSAAFDIPEGAPDGNIDELIYWYKNQEAEPPLEIPENIYDYKFIADGGLNILSDWLSGIEIGYETETPDFETFLWEASDGRLIPNSQTLREAVVFDPADDVISVTVDGEPTEAYGVVYHEIDGEWYVDRIITRQNWTDAHVDIELACKPSKFVKPADSEAGVATGVSEEKGFFADNPDYTGSSHDAVVKCTVACEFDGRIFLTGNPELPNTVFYTHRDLTGYSNPLYFGINNYFNDGTGFVPNVAMLAKSDSLMVFKQYSPQEATVYYHTGADSDNDVVPRIYPSVRGVSGIGAVGAVLDLRDDPIFLSRHGVEGIGRLQTNLERSILHRSTLIDNALAGENLEESFMVEWEGYLVLFCPSGHVYLGDTRQAITGVDNNTEYEWFCLEDVGSCSSVAQIYTLLTGDIPAREGSAEGERCYLSERELWCIHAGERKRLYLIGSNSDTVPEASVYSSYIYLDDSSNEVYYSDTDPSVQLRVDIAEYTDGKVYIVEPTGLYEGVSNIPPTAAGVSGNVLYFGTEDGKLFCVNTDKRGIPYDGDNPGPGAIHSHWYTFDGRAIESAAATAYDDAGYPGLSKKTVKKSLVLHLKVFDDSQVIVSVRTDRTDSWKQLGDMLVKTESTEAQKAVGVVSAASVKLEQINFAAAQKTLGVVSAASFQFEELNFGNAAFELSSDVAVTVREKEKKWCRKQLLLKSYGHAPWGIYGLTYRYIIQGRLKR